MSNWLTLIFTGQRHCLTARFSFPFYANNFMVRKTSRARVLSKNRVSGSCIDKTVGKLTFHIQGNPGLWCQREWDQPQGHHHVMLDPRLFLSRREVSSCPPLSLEMRTVSLPKSFFLTDRTWSWGKAFFRTFFSLMSNLATPIAWGLTWSLVWSWLFLQPLVSLVLWGNPQ